MARPQVNNDEQGKIIRDTTWKLVDARCQQLHDIVSATRMPFLLALTWSLIWAWSLYNNRYSYMIAYRDQLAAVAARAEPEKKPQADHPLLNLPSLASNQTVQQIDSAKSNHQFNPKLETICDRLIPDLKDKEKLVFGEKVHLEEWQKIALCTTLINKWSEHADHQVLESNLILFPGGFAKINVNDLGILGNASLLLILFWLFFTSRRENHSVRSFVDMDNKMRKNNYLLPQEFTLIAQDKIFSGAHLSYAYQAVCQRFVFIFSQHSRPLLFTTIFLCLLPLSTSAFNFISDVSTPTPSDFGVGIDKLLMDSKGLSVRMLIEAILSFVVGVLTINIIGVIVETSVLLNAWQLAVEHVWIKDWDAGPDTPPAPNVTVYVHTQHAKRTEPEK
jgi:hypothetical protein